MKKNPHGKILRWEPKKQHLSTVSKSYPLFRIFPKKKKFKNFGGAKAPLGPQVALPLSKTVLNLF